MRIHVRTIQRPRRRTAGLVVTTVTTAGLLAACAGAPEPASTSAEDVGKTRTSAAAEGFPVTIKNCGREVTVTEPPDRAVTLNQGATEVALALDLQDRLAGTAYLDDQVPQRWQQAYESVPVLSEEYPPQEKLLARDPDFAYASYSSAFEAKAVGTRKQLAQQDIATYVSPFGCPDDTQQPEASYEAVWSEIHDVARAFGVPERAEALQQRQQEKLEEIREEAPGEGLEVFWYDSNTKTPVAGAGGGGPQLVLEAVGATNIVGHLDGSWADVSWETVVAAEPDVIVLADAAWSSAQKKIRYLANDPVLSQLSAVQQQRYVTVPFSASTPGVRLVEGAQTLAEQLEDLDGLDKS